MVATIEADFGGWATKAGLKCTDGRTIMRGAFEHMDKQQVPLVYQHGHNKIDNILGHAILEHRDEGIYAYAFFNETDQGQKAKAMVKHRDLKHLSIYANGLVEKGMNVVHGMIREVSLVLAGANPGAVIDFVNLQHSDGSRTMLEDEAVITDYNTEIEHALDSLEEDGDEDGDEGTQDNAVTHADGTVGLEEIFNHLDEDEQNAVYYVINAAVNKALEDAASASHSEDGASSDDSDEDKTPEGDLIHNEEGAGNMPRNVFDQAEATKTEQDKHVLTHDAMTGIFEDAKKRHSLKDAVENYALQHGIDNIDVLFPDAKAATGVIELDKRRTEWVASVINGVTHTPFSRIKTFAADLTQDEARAKGYITGEYKKEEWFGVTKRVTTPTTIYKKQKVDRDDVLDITDFDIVTFVKGEMRLMTEEEVARAILIGDGRDVSDEDKVKDPAGAAEGAGVRSVLNDHELFVTTINVNVGDSINQAYGYEEVVDAVMDGMEYYKGTGTPTLFTTIPQVNKFLQSRDDNGQRFYKNKQEVADALGVKEIITVEPMKEVAGLIGIIVNLQDFNVGTDRGGEINTFDDFDIDYNQYKYLMETRMSGALLRPKTAIVIRTTAASNVLATPAKPLFNKDTGVITIPTVTGVVYKDEAGTTLTAGALTALAAGETKRINTVPASGYYFRDNQSDGWPFQRPRA